MQIETAIHGSKGQITTIISIMFAKSYTYYQLTRCTHDFTESKTIVLLRQFFFKKKNFSQRKKLIMAINPIYKTTDDNMIYQNLRCFFFFFKENT